MLGLRFLVGLGIGGVWPNAVALAAECWPDKSRPIVAGLVGAALNGGILMLSQIARTWHITPESWRWIFFLAAAPAVLGLLVLFALPESPLWLAKRQQSSGTGSSATQATGDPVSQSDSPIRELIRPPLLRLTLIGILLGSIPMVGAWAASKWMIPWADKVGGATEAGYKAITQGWWALGAVLGSFFGAQIAAWLGRRRAYGMISAGATTLTLLMFLGTAPLQVSFLPIVFAQGFVATLFFGWLALYLPELFPTRVRAAGSGIAYNVGRFVTAAGVLVSGILFTVLGGSYSAVGAFGALVYVLGLIAIWWAPDTSHQNLDK
jgi:MFS family permease